MSVQIHWETLNNDVVSSFLTSSINYVIMQNKHLLLGGFAYVDQLQLGETPPSFEFLSVETMTDDHIVGEIAFGYDSDLLIKANAYAPINPLQSTSRFAKRSRSHMNVAQSAAPGYINAWACIRDVQIQGKAKIEYKAFTAEQRQRYIAEQLAQMSQSTNANHEEVQEFVARMKIPKGIVNITLNSFPLKQVRLSFAFDGSVLAEMVGGMINDHLNKAKDMLKQQSYSFSLPI